MTKIKNDLVIMNNSSDTILIDARLLHSQLHVSTKFAMWIERRINEFGFEEGKDFFPKLGSKIFKRWGGNNAKDYHLTMDMAKELAMLERNEVGRHIRRYFIAVEKEARKQYEPSLNGGNASTLELPEEIEVRVLNDRELLPYHEFLGRIGASQGGGSYQRVKTYPNHFVKMDGLTYVSREMAMQIMVTNASYKNRQMLKDMQPVLALDFGAPIEKKGGRA